MNDWRNDIFEALCDFETVSRIAGEPIGDADFEVRYLHAPHRPGMLPFGWMAVYGFWRDGAWLKIGKAGPNSGPRFTSHHYNLSAPSSLARSLVNDPALAVESGFDPLVPGEWIKANSCRVDILMPSHRPMELLSLLEAFLHLRLRPRYEGKSRLRI